MSDDHRDAATAAAEEAISRLLQVSDGAARYDAARQLRERLPWVQAISASQLAQEDPRGMSGASEQLGVSRQHLDRMLREHDQPSPRRRRGPDEEAPPVYHYGWAQGVYGALADRADEVQPARRWRDQHDRIMDTGWARPALLARSRELGDRCLRILPVGEREQWQQAIEEALDQVPDELPANLGMSHQWHVILGYHHARARI